MREIVLGTAGHVDHGKTSFIRALTGFDTDRLKEEKKRGITIELGTKDYYPDNQAFFYHGYFYFPNRCIIKEGYINTSLFLPQCQQQNHPIHQ